MKEGGGGGMWRCRKVQVDKGAGGGSWRWRKVEVEEGGGGGRLNLFCVKKFKGTGHPCIHDRTPLCLDSL